MKGASKGAPIAGEDAGRSQLRCLYALSWAFLLVPNLLFVLGWLRWPVGLVLALMMGAFLLPVLKSAPWLSLLRSLKSGRRQRVALFILVLAGVWVAVAGIGGLGYQNSDYVKHNAMLKDLIERSWPVQYPDTSLGEEFRQPYLSYYVAYYLPSAAVGKLWGWHASQAAAMVWAIAGLTLALAWFWFHAGGGWWTLGLFVAASGMDAVGTYLRNGIPPGLSDHIEWWYGGAQLSSHMTQLVWVPQHALVGWIAAGMAMLHLRDESSFAKHVVLIAATLLWSPFVAVGLTAWVVLCVGPKVSARQAVRDIVTDPRALALTAALTAVVGLYIAGNYRQIPGQWLWTHSTFGSWREFVFFWLLEIGIVSFLCFPRLAEPSLRTPWFMAVITITLFLSYRFGLSHDLGMRAAIPALFCFWAGVAAAVKHRVGDRRPLLLILALVIGGWTALGEAGRSFRHGAWSRWSFAPLSDAISVIAIPSPGETLQYMGDPDSVFFRYLARR